MVVIGGIIGSGIFINPYLVARPLDTPALVLAAWAVGGARRARRRVRLRRARPADAARGRPVRLPARGLAPGRRVPVRLGAALHDRNRRDGGRRDRVRAVRAAARRRTRGVSPRPLAIAAIVVLSAINYVGVKPGSRVLNVFVVLKVAALAVLILFAWFQSRRARRGSRPDARRRHADRRAGVRRRADSDPVRLRRLAERELRRRGDARSRAPSAAQPRSSARWPSSRSTCS